VATKLVSIIAEAFVCATDLPQFQPESREPSMFDNS
jgi:hypothetical protein